MTERRWRPPPGRGLGAQQWPPLVWGLGARRWPPPQAASLSGATMAEGVAAEETAARGLLRLENRATAVCAAGEDGAEAEDGAAGRQQACAGASVTGGFLDHLVFLFGVNWWSR